MSENQRNVPDAPPSEIGASIHFDALSGQQVKIEKASDSDFTVTYLGDGHAFRLIQDGPNSYNVEQPSGSAAIGGGPFTWDEFTGTV